MKNGRIVYNLDKILQNYGKGLLDHQQTCVFCGGLELTKEKQIGLVSSLVYECTKRSLGCSFSMIINTADTDVPDQNSNDNVVRGATSIGIEFSQVEEFCCVLGIPNATLYSYEKSEEKVANEIEQAVVKSLQNAIEEEKFLAEQRGEERDADGFWRIPVIVDGGWAKRSYGHSFNSKSGVAVICGRFSRKILYVGVKNTFCTICSRVKTLKERPRPHKCAANWNGFGMDL